MRVIESFREVVVEFFIFKGLVEVIFFKWFYFLIKVYVLVFYEFYFLCFIYFELFFFFWFKVVFCILFEVFE